MLTLTLITVFTLLVQCISVTGKGPRPLVLWHGLGDSYASPGMLEFVQLIKGVHPGIFVHSVYISEKLEDDRKAGFYGNVNEQIALVADQLASIPELEGGFDALGFSQGGQFLRAYVERYNTPQVHNLITFGSQHMGISDIPVCARYDFLCQVARRAAKGAVYGGWAQNNLVQAQYFRDPTNYKTYLEANHFLTSINNERPDARNATYANNLASLNKLVLVLFTEDKTVVPKESSWFGSEPVPEDDSGSGSVSQQLLSIEKQIIPMRLQPLYKEDWIGLRKLDERGDVVLETCQGEHMEIGECWERIVRGFAGGQMG
ncbi:palmitoyl-protein thioesterase [Coprinopsis cinerea okayama7|uniref:Palmitoyl-protein thioesterase 1 n=1 Tax=Coprinopsis cinerea (strain Okayama-7 / 130 / ATCC MYA-4618 / FGSC 9003) TaxID=240176 RepID=A8N6J9_COPC7|nr:palmitoyl-protein thioesterase [Coprinopsis cinerea okayama7\|eukprot:XP_001830455.2 palmitoyl-protein thioesterase [Coprinopsis cinerea okayama7\